MKKNKYQENLRRDWIMRESVKNMPKTKPYVDQGIATVIWGTDAQEGKRKKV